MQEFEVIFYDKEDGTVPAQEFVLDLDKKWWAKMLRRTISILADNGTEPRGPYSRPLDDGIFELRAKVGLDISRVLYFFFVDWQVIITNGFVKKHRKHFLLK